IQLNESFAVAVAIQPADQFIVLGCDVTQHNVGHFFGAVRLDTLGHLDVLHFNAGHTLPGVRGMLRIPYANFQGGTTFTFPHDLTLQADGKIIMVGQANPENGGAVSSMAAVRLTTTGGLDIGFNTNHTFFGVPGVETIWTASFQVGTTLAQALAVTVQPDGKIVMVGSTFTPPSTERWAVVRLNSDGTLDNTWNQSGTFSGVPG